MNATRLVLAAGGAMALFALGVYVGVQWSSPAREVAGDRSQASAVDSVSAQLREENRRLRDEVAELRAGHVAQVRPEQTITSAAHSAPQGNAWRLLAALQRQKLAHTRVTFLNDSGSLNEAFVQVFELTPVEHETLQESIDSVRAQLDALERENATVTRNAAGGFVISVKPFAEAGGAIYDEFLESFEQTLGPERYAAFLTLGAEQVERALGRFGAAQRTVTVTVEQTSSARLYRVNDEQLSPGGRNSSGSVFLNRGDLVKRVGPIARLLPPEL